MKFFGPVLTLFITFFISSCQNSDSVLVPADNSDNSNYIYSPEKLESDEGDFVLLQNIDGNTGGTIAFDTSYMDINGDSISMSIKLKFLPKSFSGIKEIQIIPDLATGSIQFFPHMDFTNLVLVDLYYKGIDLAKLSFDSNSKADFVFQDENGQIEYTLSKGCVVIWNQSLIFVKSAQLKHFSRYIFVRKCQ
jgi:hypothetical protein